MKILLSFRSERNNIYLGRGGIYPALQGLVQKMGHLEFLSISNKSFNQKMCIYFLAPYIFEKIILI